MTATDAAPPPRKSRLPLLLGVVLGLAGAGGGFMATRMGLFGPSTGEPASDEAHAADDAHASDDSHAADDGHAAEDTHAAEGDGHGGGGAGFVPLDPMIVNVGSARGDRFLRFVAQIEVNPGKAAAVEAIKPQFADVLNGYLRAVDIADLEDPRALDLLRGQMLRRLQTVAGEGAIRDLLIVEFVLN